MIPISFIQSIMNHIPQLPQPSIELKPGQIFQGAILKILPENQALVQLGGVKVLARLEANLQAGEKAWLQVQSSQQPVSLKVLTTMEPGTGRMKLAGENVGDLAKAIGIDHAVEHPQLLSKVLQEGLAVDKKAVRTAQSVLMEQGGDPEVLESALFAMKRGLPVTRETILSLRSFLFGSGTVKMAEELKEELASLLSRADLKEARTALNPPQSDPAVRTDRFPKWLGKAEEVLDKVSKMQHAEIPRLNGEAVKELLKGMGVMWEREILERGPLSEAKDQLKPLLLQLRDGLKEMMPHTGKAVELSEKLIQHITGQQLLAIPSDSPMQQYIFHLPLHPFANSPSFVQIEAKKKGKGEIDSENCRLLFYLHLNHLGDVVIDVSIYNRIVGVEIHGEHPDLPAISHSFKDQLSVALTESGYTLSSLKTAKKVSGARPSASNPFENGLATPYKGVDIRI